MRTIAGVKESAPFENPDRVFDSDEGRAASIQEMITDLQRGSKTSRLWGRHGTRAGTPVRKNDWSDGFQFRSRSLVL